MVKAVNHHFNVMDFIFVKFDGITGFINLAVDAHAGKTGLGDLLSYITVFPLTSAYQRGSRY